VWTFDEKEVVDAAFFERRIAAALETRAAFGFLPLSAGLNEATRLIHAESDRLPGLVVDRYGDTLVMQVLSAGADAWKMTFVEILQRLTGCATVYERSDADVREFEGLPSVSGVLAGEVPAELVIAENGIRFKVDVVGGHKTGFYLDQRFNRQRVGELARGKDVLNCFCYTGGFSLYAAKNGAKSVLSLDSSEESLRIAKVNEELNGLSGDTMEWREADVFTALRKFRDERRSFDMIILDPPKFAATTAQVERASRAYKDINLLAFKLLRPGGILATFSCSGGIDAGLFQKIVAGAALDANVEAQITEHLSQSADHPVSIHFPEGTYLKGLIVLKK
jgi:23S rRNA (cytosine1962-C5)-methyltransferase